MGNSSQRCIDSNFRIPDYEVLSTSVWEMCGLFFLLTFVCPLQINAQPNLQEGDYAITTERIHRGNYGAKYGGYVRKGSVIRIINPDYGDETGNRYLFWGRRISSPRVGDDIEREIVKTKSSSNKIKELPDKWGHTPRLTVIRGRRKLFIKSNKPIRISKQKYWANTYFEVVRKEEEHLWIAGKEGRMVKIDKDEIGKSGNSKFVRSYIGWDKTDNNISQHVSTEYSDTYLLGELFYSHSYFLWIFILFSVIYLKVSSEGNKKMRENGYFIFILPICLLAYLIYKGGQADAAMQESFRTMFKLHLTKEGRVLPIDQIRTNASNMVGYTLADFTWIIYYPLWYIYLGYFAYLIPSFVRGLHYLSLPEPTDEHLEPDDSDLPPDIDEKGFAEKAKEVVSSPMRPAWMARNEARKARANAEKIKSWSELVEAVRNYKVTRSLSSDQNDESE